jgi:hypothetical protein
MRTSYIKICGWWVPKQLTDEQKQAHMEACMQFFQQCHEGKAFLQWIVTGDDTWVHQYEPASKYQSMEWKYISSPRKKKCECPFCQQNDVDTILEFRSAHPPVLPGLWTVVNSAQYCAMLEGVETHYLQHMQTNVILLHHDNT